MTNDIVEEKNKSLIVDMANKYGLSAQVFQKVIKETVMPSKRPYTQEQLAAFLLIAKKYDLNPLTKEIYAFPMGGGIQTIISVDGWVKMINQHPEYDGMEFIDNIDDCDQMISIECKIYRKDKAHPISANEYMEECKRETDIWKKWPRRMLRHKALIQAARYAFGFSGVIDPDEAERMGINEGHHPRIKNPLEIEISSAEEIETEEKTSEEFENLLGSVKENILAECERPDATIDEIKKECERQRSIGLSLAQNNQEIKNLDRLICHSFQLVNGEITLDALKKIFND